MNTPAPIHIPLGVRLNNPGCIRWNGTQWRHGSPDTSGFVRFDAPEWGFRAIALILHAYEQRGIHTIEAAINEWSPPSENDTAAYIEAVCNECGIGPKTLMFTLVTPAVLTAICRHECGVQPYGAETINLGISLAEATWKSAQ